MNFHVIFLLLIYLKTDSANVLHCASDRKKILERKESSKFNTNATEEHTTKVSTITFTDSLLL